MLIEKGGVEIYHIYNSLPFAGAKLGNKKHPKIFFKKMTSLSAK
jgi:hypothetical protein